MAQLQLEWLVFLDRHRLAHDSSSGKFADDGRVLSVQQLFDDGRLFFALAQDPGDVAFLRAVIQGNVAGGFTAAEDANLAHALRTDTTDSKVGHTTVGKLQPRVGDVFRLAEDWDADGIDTNHRRTHEAENDVQVVDHQIEHDADVCAAIRI